MFETNGKKIATTHFINQVIHNMWDKNRFLKSELNDYLSLHKLNHMDRAFSWK